MSAGLNKIDNFYRQSQWGFFFSKDGFFFKVYLFILREREGMCKGREGENPKQGLHHQHGAQRGARTHECEIMT